MKKLIAITILASSFCLFSCGNAEKVAKELMDSIRNDSLAKAQVKIDSLKQADSIDKAIKVSEDNAKRISDSMGALKK